MHDSDADSLAGFGRGFRWEGGSDEERRHVIDAAFDFRGDVTLTLRGGERLEGYVSNRDFDAPEPFLQIFPRSGGRPVRIPCGDVDALEVTGRDTAEGKSFDTWLKKYQERKAAEDRGEVRGSIDLYPDPLE